MCSAKRDHKRALAPWDGVTDGCDLSGGCSELNLVLFKSS